MVQALREDGHSVYDYRHPPRATGFSMHYLAEIIESEKADRMIATKPLEEWGPKDIAEAFQHPVAQRAFEHDNAALEAADAVVMVLPCGMNAHLELGKAIGMGKHTVILMDDASKPELMYFMADRICHTIDEVSDYLYVLEGCYPRRPD